MTLNRSIPEIKDKLEQIIESRQGGPFLFIGSGFSRRYLGLEDWKELLSKFCVTGRPLEYYLAKANSIYPRAAKFLAEDFNEYWWNAEEYKKSVFSSKTTIVDNSSALRLEISNYLSSLDYANIQKPEYLNEIELLSSLNVDGIITTNWDTFLEQIFPDYQTYIGQKELLFSNPQEIGEIYKIHGSCSNPESLVLTSDDYEEFNRRNAYLAAKLITIFVEHPVVFIGYSLSDENISNLLRALSECIGKNNIEQLRKNLIFVQALENGEEEGISDTYLSIDHIQIPLILVKTDDFQLIFEALSLNKRKIPARILRYCKEQLYDLVNSAEPEKKLCVVHMDELNEKTDVEFVVGIGVVSERIASEKLGEKGYISIEVLDLLHDVLHEDRGYYSNQILKHVLQKLSRSTTYIPVFKYLHDEGINNLDAYKKSGLTLDKLVSKELSSFQVKQYKSAFYANWNHHSIDKIIDGCTTQNAAAYIPFMQPKDIDLQSLKAFLIANEGKMDYQERHVAATNLRKLVVLYDKLKWGW